MGKLLVAVAHPAGLGGQLGHQGGLRGTVALLATNLAEVWSDAAYTEALGTWMGHEFDVRVLAVKRSDAKPGI